MTAQRDPRIPPRRPHCPVLTDPEVQVGSLLGPQVQHQVGVPRKEDTPRALWDRHRAQLLHAPDVQPRVGGRRAEEGTAARRGALAWGLWGHRVGGGFGGCGTFWGGPCTWCRGGGGGRTGSWKDRLVPQQGDGCPDGQTDRQKCGQTPTTDTLRRDRRPSRHMDTIPQQTSQLTDGHNPHHRHPNGQTDAPKSGHLDRQTPL